jgi:2'-5' RNA ligase
VNVPTTAREWLDQTARRASTHWPSGAVRWTPSGNQHLTLRFLGDTTPEHVTAMDDIAASVAPLELGLDRTGVFPEKGPPRVLWMGLRADAGYAALLSLQQQL